MEILRTTELTKVFHQGDEEIYAVDHVNLAVEEGAFLVVTGRSGSGKTTLLNILACIDKADSGALVIDTPGMRALGMWDVTEGLDESFADVAGLAERCRFRNCTHRSEPGCAVRAALAEGSLPQARWDSYCKLRQEAAYADAPEAYLRRKTEKNKQIAQFNRKRKTNR